MNSLLSRSDFETCSLATNPTAPGTLTFGRLLATAGSRMLVIKEPDRAMIASSCGGRRQAVTPPVGRLLTVRSRLRTSPRSRVLTDRSLQ
jgi:hypothetical protein